MGKFLAVVLVGCTVLAGVGMWYLQVYGYYDTLPAQDRYAIALPDGATQELVISGFAGIDSTSSPLRYRACFVIDGAVTGLPYDDAEPLYAPGWFDCFDAPALGADLAAGRARAVLVAANQPYGFDRVMALYADGRAHVWPQINACGAAHFDGDPLPAGCPTPPTR